MQGTIVSRSVKVEITPRVKQLMSMFDVAPETALSESWEVGLDLPDQWSIGAIVGPSGSGKSSILSDLFGEYLLGEHQWPHDLSILDGFPQEMPIKSITEVLSAVGFGTVTSWVKPYHVLSEGEKFRASMAYRIATARGMMAVDEFTSVIDRKVAQAASSTIARYIRKNGVKLVVASCHFDILEWLQPDWVYQPSGNLFQRRLARRRPEIELQVYPVRRAEWGLFKKYHYLSAAIHTGAKCFGGFIEGDCVAFISYIHFPHPTAKNIKRVHRLVVHPDYQGLGIATALSNWIGQFLNQRGFRVHYVVSNPAMVSLLSGSPRWRLVRKGRPQRSKKHSKSRRNTNPLAKHQLEVSTRRSTWTFAYTPQLAA